MSPRTTRGHVVALAVAFVALTHSAVFAAGNISVRYDRGDVIVTGDSQNNDLQISRSVQYQHVFKGLNGTTINGSSRSVVLPIYDDLKIDLASGDDFLDIRSLRATYSSHADLVVQLGNGDDELLLRNAYVARNVRIDSDLVDSFGNDIVDVHKLRSADRLTVKLFNGVNEFRAAECDIQFQLTVDALDVSIITIHLNDVANMDIDSGFSGADTIKILGNDTDAIWLSTSSENDDVQFLMNKIRRCQGYAYLLDGDDLLDFRMNEVGEWGSRESFFIINTGDGFDDGLILKGFLAPVIVQAFEGVNK